jgi:hypothetical protein
MVKCDGTTAITTFNVRAGSSAGAFLLPPAFTVANTNRLVLIELTKPLPALGGVHVNTSCTGVSSYMVLYDQGLG